MENTIVVVANKANARFFSYKGPKDGLVLKTTMEHPRGRVKGIEFDTDRPGQTFDRKGQGHHNMNTEESSREHEDRVFAKEIAVALSGERTNGGFHKLVIVAEPKFLGVISGELDTQTANLIHSRVLKDLARVTDRDILGHIRDSLPSTLA